MLLVRRRAYTVLDSFSLYRPLVWRGGELPPQIAHIIRMTLSSNALTQLRCLR